MAPSKRDDQLAKKSDVEDVFAGIPETKKIPDAYLSMKQAKEQYGLSAKV